MTTAMYTNIVFLYICNVCEITIDIYIYIYIYIFAHLRNCDLYGHEEFVYSTCWWNHKKWLLWNVDITIYMNIASSCTCQPWIVYCCEYAKLRFVWMSRIRAFSSFARNRRISHVLRMLRIHTFAIFKNSWIV